MQYREELLRDVNPNTTPIVVESTSYKFQSKPYLAVNFGALKERV